MGASLVWDGRLSDARWPISCLWGVAPAALAGPERSAGSPNRNSSASRVRHSRACARRLRAFPEYPVIAPLDSAVARADRSDQGVPTLQHDIWMNSGMGVKRMAGIL